MLNIEDKLPKYTNYSQNSNRTSNERLADEYIVLALLIDDAKKYKKRLSEHIILSFFSKKEIADCDKFIKEKQEHLVYELNQCVDFVRKSILKLLKTRGNPGSNSCVKLKDKELTQDKLNDLRQKGGQMAFDIYYNHFTKEMFNSLNNVHNKELRKKEILKIRENYISMDEETQEEILKILLKEIVESNQNCSLDADKLDKLDEQVYAFNAFEKVYATKKEEVFEKEKKEEIARVEKERELEAKRKIKRAELKEKLKELKKEYVDVFSDVCEINR